MSTIKDNFNSLCPGRIKEERQRLGISQLTAGELCGVSREMWGKYERGAAVPGGEVLFSLASAGVDIQYVLTGQKVDALKKDNSMNELCEIPHYSVEVSAGFGFTPSFEEELNTIAFKREWLIKHRLNANSLVIVDVKGKSMEPYLKDGDLVIVDKSQTNIIDGKTYVLRIDGNLFVKNLQLLPNSVIQVVSFNSGFPPYQITLRDESLDIAIIGRVVAAMNEW